MGKHDVQEPAEAGMTLYPVVDLTVDTTDGPRTILWAAHEVFAFHANNLFHALRKWEENNNGQTRLALRTAYSRFINSPEEIRSSED